MTHKLTSGDQFPELTLSLAQGGSLTLPQNLDSTYTIVLFYRGHW